MSHEAPHGASTGEEIMPRTVWAGVAACTLLVSLLLGLQTRLHAQEGSLRCTRRSLHRWP